MAAAIFVLVSLLARLIDWALQRRPLHPEAVTRYRVFRRTISAIILAVGLFSALLAIPEVRAVAGGLLASSALLVVPQVRAVAGGVLASSAVIGLVIGFASQRTIGNAVAGILIAVTQPLRLGDEVEVQGTKGVVEEIGLTYTFIRTGDRRRLVVPNEKLASDTIVNASIRGRETFAEVSVPVPLAADLEAALDALREDVAGERDAQVYVSSLADSATVTVRAVAADDVAALQLERELRLRAQKRLRALGVWA